MYVMINFSCSINLGIKILTPSDRVLRGGLPHERGGDARRLVVKRVEVEYN